MAGDNGNDSLSGDDGADTIAGNEGNDTIPGGNGNDRLDGGEGYDVVHGGADDDWLLGGANDDTLSGDQGDDRVFGGDGSDLVHGSDGDDLLYDGDGADTFVIDHDEAFVDVIGDLEAIDRIGLVKFPLSAKLDPAVTTNALSVTQKDNVLIATGEGYSDIGHFDQFLTAGAADSDRPGLHDFYNSSTGRGKSGSIRA